MPRFLHNTAVAKTTIIFSVLLLVACIANIAISAYSFPMLDINGNITNRKMSAPENIIGAAYALVGFVQSIVFCIWFYRVYNNLRIVSPPDKKIPSWLVIVSWFIPLIGLVPPYFASNGVRKAYNRVLPIGNIFQRSPVLLNIWWLCFAIATSTGPVFWLYIKFSHLHPAAATWSGVDLVSLIFHFTGVIFSILIIKNINKLEYLFLTFKNDREAGIFSQISPGAAQSFD